MLAVRLNYFPKYNLAGISTPIHFLLYITFIICLFSTNAQANHPTQDVEQTLSTPSMAPFGSPVI